MILRYQEFTQGLNNIQKVCILGNMLVDGLSLVRAPAATLAWRRDVARAFVLGYEILSWESDFPNPSLCLPIPVATAHETARLLAQCYPSQAGRGWFDHEALAIEKSVLDSGSDYSVN
jgi:hypothetical protein